MNGMDAWDLLYLQDRRLWKGRHDEVIPLHGTVLELGVGNGKNLSALPPDAMVIGVDFSRNALLSCIAHHSIPLVQADVLHLPFRDGSVDGISASHILGHLDAASRSRAAAEAERVLRKDGLLYVSVFGERDMRYGKGVEVEERTFRKGNGIACHYFIEGEVESLFPRFKVLRSWERELVKRYNGRVMVRQERRSLLQK